MSPDSCCHLKHFAGLRFPKLCSVEVNARLLGGEMIIAQDKEEGAFLETGFLGL